MSEFDLIQHYFTKPTQHTNLSIGDDAALISVSEGHELAISTDMLISGTHFFRSAAPYSVGWKSLAVNLSDMAAMGADPKWATLSIALPSDNPTWLSGFSGGFFACANAYNVDLIGGDTTRGALTISVQMMGEVPKGKAIKRSGAQVGDDIWVSNQLGKAALALAHLLETHNIPDALVQEYLQVLNLPQPRISLGLALRNVASSAIDVSDGLVSEVGHIIKASKTKLSIAEMGAVIYLDKIPTSSFIHKNLSQLDFQKFVLAGGDDYELCFTANPKQHDAIDTLSSALNLTLTKVGKITAKNGVIVLDKHHQAIILDTSGYNHFR